MLQSPCKGYTYYLPKYLTEVVRENRPFVAYPLQQDWLEQGVRLDFAFSFIHKVCTIAMFLAIVVFTASYESYKSNMFYFNLISKALQIAYR